MIDALQSYELTWLTPLALPAFAAILLLWPACRPAVLRLAPWLALPGLLLALTGSERSVDVPWLLLGARFELDATGQVFLLFTALIWLLAGLYARPYLARDPARHRFFAFFLLTMSGNLGLVLAGDVVSFYVFFALMSFASYGLIVHRADAAALRAGRVYMVMVVIGELLLFAGLLTAAHQAGGVTFVGLPAAVAQSPARDLILGLLLVGFGIKAGTVGLHMWLPLAHPAAPTPASAVLSGAMIKAGLLGWLRVLPLGEAALPVWGGVGLAAGLFAAFYGVLIGLSQQDPKATLAYSSVSQMGIMTVGLGAGLIGPAFAPLVLAAVAVYALHHGLAKAALFLSVGVASSVDASLARRVLFAAGVLLPAAALAGAPWTSGLVAKVALKRSLDPAAIPWAGPVEVLLTLAAVGTTLLMARFLYLVWPKPIQGHQPPSLPLWLAWLAAVLATASVVWVIPWETFHDLARQALTPAYLWASLWPPALGLILAYALLLLHDRGQLRLGHIPPGDLLVPLAWTFDRLVDRQPRLMSVQFWSDQQAAWRARWDRLLAAAAPARRAEQLEQTLRHWPVVGLAFLLLAALLLVLLAS